MTFKEHEEMPREQEMWNDIAFIIYSKNKQDMDDVLKGVNSHK